MNIVLANISIKLYEENSFVRIKYNKENVLLKNQNIDAISIIIKNNFNKIYSHYSSLALINFNPLDLSEISISVVLHYLYMYNNWNNACNKTINYDLNFKDEDFDNPNTLDIIIQHYKIKYPIEWMAYCQKILGLKNDELNKFLSDRESFNNK